MNTLTQLEKASKLPAGHYGKAEAQAAVEKEYKACHEQSLTLTKQYRIKKRYFDNPQEAMDLCISICDLLGHKHLKSIVLRSPDVSRFAGAHYGKGEIHFPSNWISTNTLLHELTHHLGALNHGKRFLEFQELVYQAAMESNKDLLCFP